MNVARARLMLARNEPDDDPVVVGAIDQAVWDHWDDEDEADWEKSCRDSWGLGLAEFRQVWAVFTLSDLRAAYETPDIEGRVDV